MKGKWHKNSRALGFNHANMILTKYIKSVFPIGRALFLCSKEEGDWMKISDRLPDDQKEQLNKLHKPKKKQKKEEYVNWHEIMGSNRDTYGRRRGAIRSRKK